MHCNAHLVFWFLVCYAATQLATPLHQRCIQVLVFFVFLVCFAATQLATQLPQRRIQLVRSNKIARKRLTDSNGTPAMGFRCEETRKRRYTQTKNITNTQQNSKLGGLMCWRVQSFIFPQTIVFIYLFVHTFDYV